MKKQCGIVYNPEKIEKILETLQLRTNKERTRENQITWAANNGSSVGLGYDDGDCQEILLTPYLDAITYELFFGEEVR